MTEPSRVDGRWDGTVRYEDLLFDEDEDADLYPVSSQDYDADLESPNEMMVDADDFVTELPENEKDDVANINPDQPTMDIDAAGKPCADDFESMKEIVLPPLLDQPPILSDTTHTWNIQDWRSLSRREHGPVFEAGGFPWRVLMFPTGNNVEQVSFYLEHGYSDGQIPDDFVCCVQFGLVLWNPNDPSLYTHHQAHHRFTKEEGDWGFTRFAELRKIFSGWDGGERPLVENDAANMTAYVRVVEDETGVLWHNFTNYDSKKETGYVGLKNQGATCYLNSLIQSLYFTNAFRKAVYQIPTQDEETLTNSAYTLQRLFYQLQTSNLAVSTNELTKSFGWETRHIFEQQDVQELSRKLMERMEEKMKGTEAEKALPNMFSGKVRTYISCINVNYESRRVEDFWDVQLNVSGNKDVPASFKDYIQVEKMDGDNKYYAGDEFKLQDANKGVIFESFPEVLNLQLKRFQYDIERDAMMKINDRYEFPETFDATPYLSDDADKSESYIYQLHSVLVHSGDLNAGHYYAFIKPTKDGWFYKYDDDKVTKATMREVLEDNYGGEYPILNGKPSTLTKTTPQVRQNSAYMLVYIRQTRVEQVLLSVTEADTPPHLQKRLEEEAAEREARRKEREEAHLYIWVKIITDETIRAYGGTDLAAFERAGEPEPGDPIPYRILRKSTIGQLKDRLAEEHGCDTKLMRLWAMVNRQNKTTRPDAPLAEMGMSIEDAHIRITGNKTPDLRIMTEVAKEVTPDGEPIWPPQILSTNGSATKIEIIMLLLKEFDVEQQALVGRGHIYISREKKVEELSPVILQKINWPETTPIRLFEEIKPTMIEPMKSKQSLKAAELQDGDIICFQKVSEATSSSRSSESERESISHLTSRISLTDSSDRSSVSRVVNLDRIEDARDFYDFLVHKRVIRFHPHPRSQNPDLKPVDIVLSTKQNYDQIAAKVGEALGVLPTHLRFMTVNANTSNPKAVVKRVSANQTLQSILHPSYSSFGNSSQRSDALFYEVLDMTLSELDTKKVVKLTWVSEGITKEDFVEILVPKNGTVEDLIASLLKKLKLEDEEKAGSIRVWEVSSNSKFNKVYPREHPIGLISEYAHVYAERLPEDELDIPPSDIIDTMHFHGEPAKAHGVPFRFFVIKDEKFADTKKRLEKRTGMKGKNFEKIKFAVVTRPSYAKPTYLNDDDILYDIAQNKDDLLGLDHPDRSRALRNGTGDLFLK